ncbi:unnamed protein product [Miscanthus lutarioriparius]|uniref:Uncharacterized protein n=1 Tax=Miscanthus lutarioriparius TaxID=422564 RepID=A0A811QMR0_9POAL|nr:unnamed protein product [Miscanthus lutarioriparius]
MDVAMRAAVNAVAELERGNGERMARRAKARRLIYITGWSVFHTIHLVRDGHGGMALGDLLRRKSQEGVRVLLLVWDDPTSRSVIGIKMTSFGISERKRKTLWIHVVAVKMWQ